MKVHHREFTKNKSGKIVLTAEEPEGKAFTNYYICDSDESDFYKNNFILILLSPQKIFGMYTTCFKKAMEYKLLLFEM
jgi:hypothetical protein